MSIYFIFFWSSLSVVSFACFRWGEEPERVVAGMFVAAAIATPLVRSAIAFRYRDVEVGVLLVDACLLAGLVWITVRVDRWWPLCVTALQLITFLSHVGKAVNPSLWRYGYQLMATWAAWPMVSILALGVLRCHLRKRRSDSTSHG